MQEIIFDIGANRGEFGLEQEALIIGQETVHDLGLNMNSIFSGEDF